MNSSIPNCLNSNACKFTPAGGKLTITTKLVIPERHGKDEDDDDDDDDDDGEQGIGHPSLQATHTNGNAGIDFHHRLSKNHLTQHNTLHSKPAPLLEWIVVRIEVTDTGCGIRPKDMVQSKLFCKLSFSRSMLPI